MTYWWLVGWDHGMMLPGITSTADALYKWLSEVENLVVSARESMNAAIAVVLILKMT